MHAVKLFLLYVICFVRFNVGFQCARGGYNNSQPQFGPGCIYRCHCVGDVQCDDDTGTCQGGCAAGWMGPGCQYGDIAYGKTASIVSKRFSYTGPENAVDGNMSSCSETNQTLEPWWRVDLNAVYRITGLVISSSEPVAMKGFEVRVGNVSSNSSADFPIICFKHNVSENISTVTNVLCTSELFGKHFMIWIPGLQSIMRLCDVRVYGGRSLAYRRNATQTIVAYSGEALRALDGGIFTWYNSRTCTHTLQETSPWWRVDLAQVYTIMRIEIYNRQDCCVERLSRFAVSFAVNDNYTLVYKYPETTPSEKTEVTNISSDRARFIQIGLPYEKQILTLCEVFVYGECPDNLCGWSCESRCFCAGNIDRRNKIDGICPGGCAENWNGSKCNSCSPRRFGMNCDQQCGKCAMDGSCSMNTGICIYGCLPGWTKDNCSIVCSLGWFGHNCSQACGHCANDSSCHHANGNCTGGCTTGYNGSLCNTVCPLGWFGQNCSQACGHCVNHSSCHHVNGNCTGGCTPGYNGSLCNTVCPKGLFGQNCSQACGYCANDSSCHHVNGTCTGGCYPGYSGSLCNTVCSLGWYGQNCSQACGHCVNDSSCHHVNGNCTSGCSPGYSGSLCNTVCSSGWFGQNCSQACGHCANDSSCDHVNGNCTGVCSPGYNGSLCRTECPSKYFGLNCDQRCGLCADGTTCDNVHGTCMNGCAPGYTGTMCNTVLKPEGKKVNIASIGGAVGGAVSALVLLLIATGLVLWKRRREPGRLLSATQQQKYIDEMKEINSDGNSNTYENLSTINQEHRIRTPVRYEGCIKAYKSTEQQRQGDLCLLQDTCCTGSTSGRP